MSYDVIVLDPPSFARNKKQTFSAAKDYHKLISQSLEILNQVESLLLVLMLLMFPVKNSQNKSTKDLQVENIWSFKSMDFQQNFVYNEKDESSNYLKVITMKVSK